MKKKKNEMKNENVRKTFEKISPIRRALSNVSN